MQKKYNFLKFYLLFSISWCILFQYLPNTCRCDGMVDVVDSKSTAGDSVPVRVRSPAPSKRDTQRVSLLFIGQNGLEPISMQHATGKNANRVRPCLLPSCKKQRGFSSLLFLTFSAPHGKPVHTACDISRYGIPLGSRKLRNQTSNFPTLLHQKKIPLSMLAGATHPAFSKSVP